MQFEAPDVRVSCTCQHCVVLRDRSPAVVQGCAGHSKPAQPEINLVCFLLSCMLLCTCKMPSLASAPAPRTRSLRLLAFLVAAVVAFGLPKAAAQAANGASGGLVSAAPTLNVTVGLLGSGNWPFSGNQQGASGQMELQGYEASASWMGSACQVPLQSPPPAQWRRIHQGSGADSTNPPIPWLLAIPWLLQVPLMQALCQAANLNCTPGAATLPMEALPPTVPASLPPTHQQHTESAALLAPRLQLLRCHVHVICDAYQACIS